MKKRAFAEETRVCQGSDRCIGYRAKRGRGQKRAGLSLAVPRARLGDDDSEIILTWSEIVRSQRMVKHAQAYIADAGFKFLGAIWPQRDGVQAEFDRAGSEAHKPYLKPFAEHYYSKHCLRQTDLSAAIATRSHRGRLGTGFFPEWHLIRRAPLEHLGET